MKDKKEKEKKKVTKQIPPLQITKQTNKQKNPRLLYPEKNSVTINGENKLFQDKNKFKQYLYINPALQKIL